MTIRLPRSVGLVALATLWAAAPAWSAENTALTPNGVQIHVDARDLPRRILHSRLVFQVDPGVVSLTYPRWIPGHHRPSGPMRDVVNLEVLAADRPIPWRRDSVDLHTLRFEPPPGIRQVEVRFDFVYPEDGGEGGEAASASDALAMLCWYVAVLYPTGVASDAVAYRAHLRLPSGWGYATALRGSGTGEEIAFEPVTLTELIDSPVLLGRHMRSIPLTTGDARPVSIELAADSKAALEMPGREIARYRRLVQEADAVFGARHFRRYRFLVGLSDVFGGDATEHHESSDNRIQERNWLEGSLRLMNAALLPHEYAHSWNGKYRRPAGLVTPTFSEPMRDELLWVYEGLTEYLGIVLAARSGLYSPAECREELATTAAFLDRMSGRAWRPLIDTAIDAPHLYVAPRAFRSWRRGVDFYGESVLIWLEADVTIRRLTNGRRSLDDFCRAFFGGDGGPPRVVPYTLDDVVAALDGVARHDWRRFLTERVDQVSRRAPMGGLEASGWRVAYADSASEAVSTAESVYDYANLYYSLGFRMGTPSGAIVDVLRGSPADRAGLSPGMTLVAVNGRKWSRDVLKDAMKASRSEHEPIALIVQNGEFYRTVEVDDHGGPRFPWLERVPGKPDVLSRILAPRRK